MITVKQEQSRINQILAQDSQATNQLDKDTTEAIVYVRAHLMAFYEHYAADTGLSVTQTSQAVSKWDLDQWKAAIADLRTDDWLPEANSRLKALAVFGGLNKGSMMIAIAGLAMVRLTNKRALAAQQQLDTEKAAEIARMNKVMPVAIKAQAVAKVIAARNRQIAKAKQPPIPDFDGPVLSDRLWLDGDQLLADTQSMMSKAYVQGLDPVGIDDLLHQHVNPAQFNPSKSLADRIKQEDYVVDRLRRTQSTRTMHAIHIASYQANNIKYVNIVCEPGACAHCIQLSLAGPYLLEDSPFLPDDTHPNCRCSIVPAVGPEDSIADQFSGDDAGDSDTGQDSSKPSNKNKNPVESVTAMLNKIKATISRAELEFAKPEEFEKAITEAKKNNRHGGSVDVVAASDVGKGWHQFLGHNKMAGVAVKDDGDIIGVFNDDRNPHRGVVTDLILTARESGGTKMDCFGKNLANAYEKAGFKPVARIPFDKKQVTDPELLAKEPDVYAMMKTDKSTEEVVNDIKAGTFAKSSTKELNSLPTIEDYNKALQYRDTLLKRQGAKK